ncbi:hypothetical protein K492DRAFT_172278 [Lichtheimia hyalospora FSU 10163]|nr:hypothetical protein K492DRAFT_172278 [Lichtheimia hyalospora FSU 10163]
MDFVTTRNRFGDIKILDHLMAVIVMCHFNALPGNSYQQLMSSTRDVIGAVAFFSLVDINLHALILNPWMFSHHAYIFLCTIGSRPGLFVPTLFVMYDQLLLW